MKTRTVTNTGIYILISALLLLSLFPVKIFTYPSMFIHFVFCAFSCTGGIIIAIAAFLKKETIPVNRFFLLPIVWLVFITLHALFIPGELYKTEYLSCTLLYPIIIGILIKHRIIKKEFLISAFGIIGIIEGVACTLQYFRIIHPIGAFFPVTGTFSNPNISALMITASLPAFLTQIKSNRMKGINYLICSFLLAILFLLECRTAIIGATVIMAVFILSEKRISGWLKKQPKKITVIIIAGVTLLLAISGSYFYSAKKDSADGRTLIWKITSGMVAEGAAGYGIGLFDKFYNSAQEQYFAKGNGTFQEKKNARHVITGYNDYLERSVEGGIIEGIFLIGFYALFITGAAKNKDIPGLSIALSSAIMSLFYTLTYTLPFWMVPLSYYGIVSGEPNARYTWSRAFRYSVACFLIITSCFWSIFQCRAFYAQVQMKEISGLLASENEKAIKMAKKYSGYISTDWTYRRMYARILYYSGNYTEALQQAETALRFTSHPSVCFLTADLYVQTGNNRNSEMYWLKVANMLPSNLRSRYLLLHLYIRQKRSRLARKMATEIIEISSYSKEWKHDFYRTNTLKYLESGKISETVRQIDMPEK